NGRRLISLRFYQSVRHMMVNVEKAGGIGALKPPMVIAMALAMLAGELLPYIAVALPQPPWALALALATCATSLATSVLMNRWQGQPALPALLVPVGAALTCGMMIRSAVLAVVRGGVPWRGTFYRLQELHQGSRFRLFGPFVRPAGPGSAAAPAEHTQRSPA
ncbi:MAG TPA: hypothetical protein VFB81_20400, partial [Myxococcales bacterium]|nr:hypothetical protein [Myxococcales bacterium]